MGQPAAIDVCEAIGVNLTLPTNHTTSVICIPNPSSPSQPESCDPECEAMSVIARVGPEWPMTKRAHPHATATLMIAPPVSSSSMSIVRLGGRRFMALFYDWDRQDSRLFLQVQTIPVENRPIRIGQLVQHQFPQMRKRLIPWSTVGFQDVRPGGTDQTRSVRRRCVQVTASEPSPTAKPTRLVDPARTSPAARTRGIVVSSGHGVRSARGQRPDRSASTPVIKYPSLSRAAESGSHSI